MKTARSFTLRRKPARPYTRRRSQQRSAHGNLPMRGLDSNQMTACQQGLKDGRTFFEDSSLTDDQYAAAVEQIFSASDLLATLL